ncbi:MAG: amidohydrolase family protein, partial [Roseitalea sp.]|nr:amidohydrolase family protein [Roseitalea sp.]
AIATDIGGGTSWSLLKTLDEGYKVLNLQGHRYHPMRAFWQATLGNAEAIGMADRIGTLDAGTEADFIVLDARATEAMALRMETVETLAEELFVLQTLGDDRAVTAAYVAGRITHATA